MKILLIEDDELMRDMISMVLNLQGHDVCAAATGADARAVFCAATYDAVISDLYLPDDDGFALHDALRAKRPQLRFLLLSGETDAAVLGKAAEQNIRFVAKDENFAQAIVAALD